MNRITVLSFILLCPFGLSDPASADARAERAEPTPSRAGTSSSADPEIVPPAHAPWADSRPWDGSESRPYWRRNLFRRFLEDQSFLVTKWWPAESRRWRFSAPLLVAVAGAAGSDAPGGIDLQWQRSFEEWTTGGRRDAATAFSRLGDAESAIVLVGGTYLISRWAGNERVQRASSLSAEALLSSAVYSTLVKKLSRRTRPASAGTGEFFVIQPEHGQSPNSFPSGHAMGAFAVATVISKEFRERRWVPWAAYGTASLVALSRVGLGRHFPSDILAGAVMGASIGRMVSHRDDGELDRRPWTRLEPIVEPGGGGVGLAYRHSW